jgi:putative PIN family toxin of toxin-antitoxin system
MRAVLDVNVLIAALLAPDGAPARLLLRWLAGDFELVISDKGLSELRRALSYPKVRSRVPNAEASAFLDLLEASATKAPDPEKSPRRSRDAGDDYLLALAASTSAVVVSGDRDVLALAGHLPVYSPAAFMESLGRSAESGRG